jgi:hypothetical protein
LYGQRNGYGKWKPGLHETVSVRATSGNTVWERHPAHKAAGHESGEVLISAQDVMSVALTPLVCQKLQEQALVEATPNQIELHKEKMHARQLAAVEAFKETCRQDYIKLTGGIDGFEAAFPRIREKKFLDRQSAA